jgi:hypothetical protein
VSCVLLYLAPPAAGEKNPGGGHARVGGMLVSAHHRRRGLAEGLMAVLLAAVPGVPTSLFSTRMAHKLYRGSELACQTRARPPRALCTRFAHGCRGPAGLPRRILNMGRDAHAASLPDAPGPHNGHATVARAAFALNVPPLVLGRNLVVV